MQTKEMFNLAGEKAIAAGVTQGLTDIDA